MQETGADKAQFEKIYLAIKEKLLPNLRKLSYYSCIPGFVTADPIARIEDLNVMAPDSIVQNIPIKYLPLAKPTRDIGRGSWSLSQRDLMSKIDQEFDNLARYMISNF